MTLDPRFLPWDRWSAETSVILLPYGRVPIKLAEAQWGEFASFAVALPTIAGLTPPQPMGYRTWRDWAFKFNECLRLLGL